MRVLIDRLFSKKTDYVSFDFASTFRQIQMSNRHLKAVLRTIQNMVEDERVLEIIETALKEN